MSPRLEEFCSGVFGILEIQESTMDILIASSRRTKIAKSISLTFLLQVYSVGTTKGVGSGNKEPIENKIVLDADFVS